MSRYAAQLPFSASYDFNATRELTLNGRTYQAGEEIDKEALPERLLRTLYESRKIMPHAPKFLFNGQEAAAAIAARDAADNSAPASRTRRAARKPQEEQTADG